MKVAIDTTPLLTGHRLRGVGYYTKNLINYLKRVDHKNEYIFFVRGQKLPKVDLIHYPYFDLFFLTLPVFKKYPTVVTIYDVIPLIFKKDYKIGLRGLLKLQIQKFSLLSAKRIITISNQSKADIHKFLGIEKDKIDVTYLAANSMFKPINDQTLLEIISEKYQLPKEFILYVGDVNFNKNLERLLEAMVPINMPLVIVGKAAADKNLKEAKKLRELANKLKISLKTLGFVPDKDLVAIYNLASVYIQPSLYEGFGLPVLEAMACGTCVVCSNSSSLPEIAGDAAIYINPNSIKSIIAGINKGLKIKDLIIKGNKDLKDRLLSQANKFSWQKTATKTVKIYQRVIS